MIDVRIDELVVDGVSGLDADAIRVATERELGASSIGQPSVEPPGRMDASRVGRELAAAVRRELRRSGGAR